MRNTLLFSGLLLLVVGCSSQLGVTPPGGLPPTPTPVDCAERLAHAPGTAAPALDADGFSLVNWNIQKGSDPDWVDDLRSAHPNPDLVMLQEAVPGNPAWADLASDHFHTFAQGFAFGTLVSGVMTTSRAEPLTECRLVAIEPWLGTHKATLVTEYALTGTDETLLVINIHGVNFAIGLGALQEQLREAQAIIAQHAGPVLFSGDFNTWH